LKNKKKPVRDILPGARPFTIMRSLALQNQYLPLNPNKFHRPKYARVGGICFLFGMVAPPMNVRRFSGVLAILPTNCRPANRAIFHVPQLGRVDVLPDGQVLFVAGNAGAAYASLSTISFPVKGAPRRILATIGQWTGYGGAYGNAPTYTRQVAYQNAQPQRVCWGAAAGSRGAFSINGRGREIAGFRLEYVNGGVRCAPGQAQTYWGCGEDHMTMISLDDSARTALFPRGNEDGTVFLFF